jgi:hypothetical protein
VKNTTIEDAADDLMAGLRGDEVLSPRARAAFERFAARQAAENAP